MVRIDIQLNSLKYYTRKLVMVSQMTEIKDMYILS